MQLIRLRTEYHKQTGASLVFAAVTMGILLLLTSLAINIGWLTYAKNAAQVAADAAALAAAVAIPHYNSTGGDISRAVEIVNSFNGDPNYNYVNSIVNSNPNLGAAHLTPIFHDGTSYAPAAPGTANGYEVRINSFPVPFPFLAKFTGANASVSVRAAAAIGGPNCITPILPIALLDCQFGGTNACALGCGANGEAYFEGPYNDTAAWFAPEGTYPINASFCKQIVNGTNTLSELCVGDIIDTGNGGMNGCTIDLDQECAPNNHDCDNWVGSGWTVQIPVISCEDITFTNGNPNQLLPVAGFTEIRIRNVISTTQEKKIEFNRNCITLGNSTAGGVQCGITAAAPILIQ